MQFPTSRIEREKWGTRPSGRVFGEILSRGVWSASWGMWLIWWGIYCGGGCPFYPLQLDILDIERKFLKEARPVGCAFCFWGEHGWTWWGEAGSSGTSWKVPGYSLEVLGAGAGVALAGAAFLGRDFLAASARWRSWWRRSWNCWSDACFFMADYCGLICDLISDLIIVTQMRLDFRFPRNVGSSLRGEGASRPLPHGHG